MDDQMRREWLAWRAVCVELADLGIDVNAERSKRFVDATRLWGEEVAALREEQHHSVGDQARAEAREKYDLQAMIDAGRIP